jgi:rhodanese-related sulfurtransferase
MKTTILIFFVLLFVRSHVAGQVPDSLKYISVAPAGFKQAMDTAKNAMLVDVREYFEFKKSRIKGAVNIPASGNLKAAADTIDGNTSLFLYCTSGFRSKRAARTFYDEGLRKLWSLDGGIGGWKKAGLPVDKKKIRKK